MRGKAANRNVAVNFGVRHPLIRPCRAPSPPVGRRTRLENQWILRQLVCRGCKLQVASRQPPAAPSTPKIRARNFRKRSAVPSNAIAGFFVEESSRSAHFSDASAIAAGSRMGTISPFLPGMMTSLAPVLGVVMTGRPHARPSVTVRAKPSSSEGSTSRSDARIFSASCGCVSAGCQSDGQIRVLTHDGGDVVEDGAIQDESRVRDF